MSQLTESLLPEPPRQVTNKVNLRDALSVMYLGTTRIGLVFLVVLAAASIGELVFNNQLGVFPGEMYGFILDRDRSGFRRALFYFILEVVGMATVVTIKL
jgi:hypothetical protein